MSIKIVSEELQIKAGMYVCAAKSLRVYCKGPRLILKVSGTRLHYEQGGKKSFMLRHDAHYVCDTEAEGEELFQLLYKRSEESAKAESRAADIARKDVYRAYMSQVEALLKR